MGSQPGGSTHTPTNVWVMVFFVIAGACALAFGIVLDELWLGIAGSAVSVLAFGAAIGMGMMAHGEE